MTQDFAKIRPEPILERRPVQAPPAWSLMLTGVIVGITIGVFGSFLFYLSGNLPPLGNSPLQSSTANFTETPETPPATQTQAATRQLDFEFYTALPNYEVTVDATPVSLGDTAVATRDTESPLPASFILQTGAFQQQELANLEMRRQLSLGLEVRVKQETSLPGRTLYLVQSGPYTTQGQLAAAEQILRRNNIQFLKTAPR